jgi:hypothetical protein
LRGSVYGRDNVFRAVGAYVGRVVHANSLPASRAAFRDSCAQYADRVVARILGVFEPRNNEIATQSQRVAASFAVESRLTFDG